jgi:hypothetical protein
MLQRYFTAGCSAIGQESELATTKLLPVLLVARIVFDIVLNMFAKWRIIGFKQGHRALS